MHYTRTEGRRDDTGERVWIGACSCGWISHPQPSERKAENEADDHAVYATRTEGT
jgi:hypothetical protein